MSEVKRWYIGVYDGEAQARVCAPHQHEFIRDTEGEIFVIAEQFDACEARNRALQQRLTAADERWDELVSAVRSINYGPAHKITVPGDDEPQYRQRKEWIEWVLGLCDTPLKPAEGGKPSTCTWSEGGFSWHTGCGKEWQFTDGGLPSENGMEFCHSCGKTLVVEGKGDE
ncbi:hypothetical protein HX776_24585 [Pseudomonas agarici]|uniref:hypothetical protein n=1 Tax=Pseudomonas agarici TaxID=46677 RepID=UPI00031C893E|nr:hypothetical protein [Pseudomonas agarici]NWC11967.1 hypothetical protein [Pseudomonas agarici]SEL92654.1 hypothetical protein SAMN05216604_1652 [Pseudomonas agarici]